MARQKRSYLYHQGEFQRNYFDFVSLHHSDHDGVVRIFVGHSEVVKRLLYYIILHYAAQFFLYQECNITRHNFLYTRSVTTVVLLFHLYIGKGKLYFEIWMSISNFSNYIVISGNGILICKAILVLPSTNYKAC